MRYSYLCIVFILLITSVYAGTSIEELSSDYGVEQPWDNPDNAYDASIDSYAYVNLPAVTGYTWKTAFIGNNFTSLTSKALNISNIRIKANSSSWHPGGGTILTSITLQYHNGTTWKNESVLSTDSGYASTKYSSYDNTYALNREVFGVRIAVVAIGQTTESPQYVYTFDYNTTNITFVVRNALNDEDVSAYNVTINGNSYVNNGSQKMLITNVSTLSSSTVTYSIVAEDYIGKTITSYEHFGDVIEVLLYPSSSISVTFIDEVSASVVNTTFFNIISDTFSSNYSTTNGTRYISDIPPGSYEIRYGIDYPNGTSSPYFARSSFFTIPLSDDDDSELDLYMLLKTMGSIFARTVIDQDGIPIENGTLLLQKYDIPTSSWITVEESNIANNGEAVFSAIANTQPYKFVVVQHGSNIIYVGTTIYLIDATGTITINTVGGLLDNLIRYRDASGVIDYLNASGTFRLTFVTTGAHTYLYCLNVTRSYNRSSAVTSSCTESQTGSLFVVINTSTPGVYVGRGYVTINGTLYAFNPYEVFIGSEIFDIEENGGFYLLAFFFILLCAAISFIPNALPFGMGLAVLGLLFMSIGFFGVLSLSTVTLMGLLFIGGILMYIYYQR